MAIVDDFKDIAARLDTLDKPIDPMQQLADCLASMPDITATHVFDHIDWTKVREIADREAELVKEAYERLNAIHLKQWADEYHAAVRSPYCWSAHDSALIRSLKQD